MIDTLTLLTIVLMACVTYLTRIAGYIIVRNMTLSPRVLTVLDAAPGCVLISVIAPRFVTDNIADLFALAITILSATRLALLPTVIIGVTSAGVLRYLFNS